MNIRAVCIKFYFKKSVLLILQCNTCASGISSEYNTGQNINKGNWNTETLSIDREIILH